jgi:hypothetical protein
MTTDLPTPPPGSWWEITGTPRGPWVWSTGTLWHETADGFAYAVEPYAIASAPGATAVWRH